MGMFDTVMFTCPSCKEVIEEQSKSGPCKINTYPLDEAPAAVAVGILGKGYCKKCSKAYRVREVTSPTYEVVSDEGDDE